VLEETQALKERQETPDAPEALTCIPCLHLSDIPKNITKVWLGDEGLVVSVVEGQAVVLLPGGSRDEGCGPEGHAWT
jgi:hypothetical protein